RLSALPDDSVVKQIGIGIICGTLKSRDGQLCRLTDDEASGMRPPMLRFALVLIPVPSTFRPMTEDKAPRHTESCQGSRRSGEPRSRTPAHAALPCQAQRQLQSARRVGGVLRAQNAVAARGGEAGVVQDLEEVGIQ